jgi:hypothetical protein
MDTSWLIQTVTMMFVGVIIPGLILKHFIPAVFLWAFLAITNQYILANPSLSALVPTQLVPLILGAVNLMILLLVFFAIPGLIFSTITAVIAAFFVVTILSLLFNSPLLAPYTSQIDWSYVKATTDQIVCFLTSVTDWFWQLFFG